MDDQKKLKQIEEIHLKYKEKLDVLKREQEMVLEKYLGELEKAKMKKIRDDLQ